MKTDFYLKPNLEEFSTFSPIVVKVVSRLRLAVPLYGRHLVFEQPREDCYGISLGGQLFILLVLAVIAGSIAIFVNKSEIRSYSKREIF